MICSYFIWPVDTVATTVDTSKNVAAAAFEKGTTAIGTAKGIISKIVSLTSGFENIAWILRVNF